MWYQMSCRPITATNSVTEHHKYVLGVSIDHRHQLVCKKIHLAGPWYSRGTMLWKRSRLILPAFSCCAILINLCSTWGSTWCKCLLDTFLTFWIIITLHDTLIMTNLWELTGINLSTMFTTSSVRVAPTNVTCAPSALDGNIGGFLVRSVMARRILVVASLKDSSKRVSASSSTRWLTSERIIRSCCLYFRRDSGVAITTSTGFARASLINFYSQKKIIRCDNSFSWNWTKVLTLLIPPISPTALNLARWQRDLATLRTWAAKSREGSTIRARGRLCRGRSPWYSSSSFRRLIRGARYARVLPEPFEKSAYLYSGILLDTALPVSEAHRTFFPRRIFGMVSICMTVGLVTPTSARAETTSALRDISEKLCAILWLPLGTDKPGCCVSIAQRGNDVRFLFEVLNLLPLPWVWW